MNRKETNLKIIAEIVKYLDEHPETRFGQALRNMDIVIELNPIEGRAPQWSNHFYEESTTMLKRIELSKMKRGLT